jgi:hypothetical protein
MRTNHGSILCPVACLAVAVLCLLGCGDQELVSDWCETEVTIDGQDGEWQGVMAYMGDLGVAIGLLNDEAYLYLCLATVDSRVVRQVVGSGLTVWFDPKGGKKRAFGIKFPLGMDPSWMGKPGENMSMPEPGASGSDPERIRLMLESSAYEMIIMGPGENESRRMPVAGSQEIEVVMGYSGGKLIYEMQVPLIRDLKHPDAVGLENGLEDGRCIGLGFETAEIDRQAMRERMRAGGPPMGGGTGGRGIPGGRRPGRERAGDEMSERLKLWTKVRLASIEREEPM